MNTRTNYESDDDRILKDGERLIVPMVAMDAAATMAHDGMGNVAGHKQGYVFADDPVAAARRELASSQYLSALADAWRGDAKAADDVPYEQWLVNAWRKP